MFLYSATSEIFWRHKPKGTRAMRWRAADGWTAATWSSARPWRAIIASSRRLAPTIVTRALTDPYPIRRAGTYRDAQRKACGNMTNWSVPARTCMSQFEVSRPAEGFAAGQDFASTGSRAILPSALQSHCLTAERAIWGCCVPRRLPNCDDPKRLRWNPERKRISGTRLLGTRLIARALQRETPMVLT